ncbi:hypothetical protein ABIA32_000810 [Streptacidiphilus sp. MAP12-20]|uniref:hypothetical protein n=1 Tax=Streptacidiphilus sp. MAP12-20 TaxID=3156299 RepID=UPI003513D1C2
MPRFVHLLCAVPVLALAAGCAGSAGGPTPAESRASASAAASASAKAAEARAAEIHAAQQAAQTRRKGEAAAIGRQMVRAMDDAGLTRQGQRDAAFRPSPEGCMVGYRIFFEGESFGGIPAQLRDSMLADGWHSVASSASKDAHFTWKNWDGWIIPTKLPNSTWLDVPFSGPGLIVELRAQSQDDDCR